MLNVAETSLWVLVKVMTSNEVPPAKMVVGANVLDTVGTLAVIRSLSGALHTPATQPVATLVLVTPEGAEMEAVLVIWVCANACCGRAVKANRPSAKDSMPNSLAIEIRDAIHWLTNLAIKDMRAPDFVYLVVTSRVF